MVRLFAIVVVTISLHAEAHATTVNLRGLYPQEAIDSCIEGYVVFKLTVIEKRAADIEILESQPPGVFDQAALRTVERYRFDKPDGYIVDNIRISFEIDDCEPEPPNKALQQTLDPVTSLAAAKEAPASSAAELGR